MSPRKNITSGLYYWNKKYVSFEKSKAVGEM